jgi:hypothetical protein
VCVRIHVITIERSFRVYRPDRQPVAASYRCFSDSAAFMCLGCACEAQPLSCSAPRRPGSRPALPLRFRCSQIAETDLILVDLRTPQTRPRRKPSTGWPRANAKQHVTPRDRTTFSPVLSFRHPLRQHRGTTWPSLSRMRQSARRAARSQVPDLWPRADARTARRSHHPSARDRNPFRSWMSLQFVRHHEI